MNRLISPLSHNSNSVRRYYLTPSLFTGHNTPSYIYSNQTVKPERLFSTNVVPLAPPRVRIGGNENGAFSDRKASSSSSHSPSSSSHAAGNKRKSRRNVMREFENKRRERDRVMFKKGTKVVYLNKSAPSKKTFRVDTSAIQVPIVLPELRPAKLPDVTDILAGHANCPGCGAHMQTEDETKPGYVNPKALENHLKDDETFYKVQQVLIDKKLRGGKASSAQTTAVDSSSSTEVNQNERQVQEFMDQLLGRDTDTIDYSDLKTFERMKKQKPLTCIRCHQMDNYGKILSHTITAEDFRNQLAKLRGTDALIVVIVDLFDIESSFIPGLGDLIGDNPVLIAGNKVDLLPRGAGMDRIRGWLRRECNSKMGLKVDEKPKTFKFRSQRDKEDKDKEEDKSQIRGVVLISSKTGENISELCGRIEKNRQGRDVYIIGCTNVGKSTLINHLLNDLMPASLYNRKPTAESKSTTAKEGDDEIDLSKITDPADIFKHEVESIQKRMQKQEEPENQEEIKKKREKKELEDALLLYGKRQPRPLLTTSPVPGTTLKAMSFILDSKTSKDSFQKKQKAYLYDTPGVINKRQILHYLDQKDWEYLLPKHKIVPHHYRLRPGRSMFLGGLVRIDYVSNEGNPQPDWDRVFFTVFASSNLPVHTTGIQKAADVYEKHFGTKMLAPPLLPKPEDHKKQVDVSQDQEEQVEEEQQHPLKGMNKTQTIRVRGSTRAEAIIDIVVAGVGWVSLTGVGDITVTVHHNKRIHVATRAPLMPYETFKITKDRYIDG